jgi:hypothetical protein
VLWFLCWHFVIASAEVFVLVVGEPVEIITEFFHDASRIWTSAVNRDGCKPSSEGNFLEGVVHCFRLVHGLPVIRPPVFKFFGVVHGVLLDKLI